MPTPHNLARHDPRSAFTLLEVLAALAIFAMVTAIIYGTFGAVTRARKRGLELAADLHGGDLVMEQLVSALRCSYCPQPKRPEFGFLLDDHGDGPGARDSIQWVKLGPALLPASSRAANAPHWTRFSVEWSSEDDTDGASIRAWPRYGLPKDFDPDNDPTPFFLGGRCVGFNCRVATNRETFSSAWEWESTWENEDTSRIPSAVEVTLYLKPLEDGDPPVEIVRSVEIPVAPLSW